MYPAARAGPSVQTPIASAVGPARREPHRSLWRTGSLFQVSKMWHQNVLKARVPIGTINAGDTVWWHPDVIHAAEEQVNPLPGPHGYPTNVPRDHNTET